jgi:hypothetical protein
MELVSDVSQTVPSPSLVVDVTDTTATIFTPPDYTLTAPALAMETATVHGSLNGVYWHNQEHILCVAATPVCNMLDTNSIFCSPIT